VVKVIRDQTGHTIYDNKPAPKYAIDPKAAYIVTNMMEDNLRYGTGAGVRSRGFYLPAAGKTGTDNDAWFAGFTSELITVVWVGYDDYRDVKMQGSKAALPIWAAFMKRAHNLRPYRRAHGFVMPDGIVSVSIDSVTGKRFSPACAGPARNELFIAGSEPLETCDGEQPTEVSSWTDDETEEANKVALAGGVPPPVSASPGTRPNVTSRPSIARPAPPAASRGKAKPKTVEIPTPEPGQPAQEKPKKGLFGRLGDIFR
jgi:penicillin-binding protein 1B